MENYPKSRSALALGLIVGLALLGCPGMGWAEGTGSVISLSQKPGEVISPTAVAVDAARQGVDISHPVAVAVRAGGITLHHTRMLHASAPNTSPLPRRLLLLQLAAIDAWPVLGVSDPAQFDSWVLRGQPTTRYRMKEMAIRIPLPKHERQGSIYEIQTRFRSKRFTALLPP